MQYSLTEKNVTIGSNFSMLSTYYLLWKSLEIFPTSPVELWVLWNDAAEHECVLFTFYVEIEIS